MYIFSIHIGNTLSRKYIIIWLLKLDKEMILKDFLLNKLNPKATHITLDSMNNVMTIEWVNIFYQITILIKINFEIHLICQEKYIQSFLEIQCFATLTIKRSYLIKYFDWQFYYKNNFLLLEMIVIKEKTVILELYKKHLHISTYLSHSNYYTRFRSPFKKNK